MDGDASTHGRNLVSPRQAATCLRLPNTVFKHGIDKVQLVAVPAIIHLIHRLDMVQVVAVPAPLKQDPEITMGPLRWVLDQAWRDGDLIHIVHVVETMVQRLEVYHGAGCPHAGLNVLPMHSDSWGYAAQDNSLTCSQGCPVRRSPSRILAARIMRPRTSAWQRPSCETGVCPSQMHLAVLPFWPAIVLYCSAPFTACSDWR